MKKTFSSSIQLFIQVFLYYAFWVHNIVMIIIGFSIIVIIIAYIVGKDHGEGKL